MNHRSTKPLKRPRSTCVIAMGVCTAAALVSHAGTTCQAFVATTNGLYPNWQPRQYNPQTTVSRPFPRTLLQSTYYADTTADLSKMHTAERPPAATIMSTTDGLLLPLAEPSITTMPQALSTFFFGRFHGPSAVVLSLLGLSAWRLLLSSSTLGLGLLACQVQDVLAITASVSFWCLQEHAMHKYLLHSDTDWYGKRIHESHHDKPYHHVSIDPAPLMLGWMMTVHVLLRMLLPLPIALSATIGYAAAGLFYEWSHFIVHTKVRFPKHSYWQRMKDHHVRHHLVDSNNWFAFSCIQVDDVFGTPTSSLSSTPKRRADRRHNLQRPCQ